MLSPIVSAIFGNGAKARVVQWLYTEADLRRGLPGTRARASRRHPIWLSPQTLTELARAQLGEHAPDPARVSNIRLQSRTHG